MTISCASFEEKLCVRQNKIFYVILVTCLKIGLVPCTLVIILLFSQILFCYMKWLWLLRQCNKPTSYQLLDTHNYLSLSYKHVHVQLFTFFVHYMSFEFCFQLAFTIIHVMFYILCFSPCFVVLYISIGLPVFFKT